MVDEFNNAFDMMLNIIKRIFKDALRTDQMIKGDAILQKTRSEQDMIIYRLLKNLIEMLSNFQLIVLHFSDSTIEQVANTNFLVCLTNSFCLLRKVRKFWIGGCQSKEMRISIETCVSMGLKLCIQSTAHVLVKGVLSRINVHSKNFAIVQNKLAMTLRSYILTITGNAELSKEVLHK
jgi:hypothetical protein